ncbi:MAG: hypothetical protein V4577_03895 [Bacteroidota bacterium]
MHIKNLIIILVLITSLKLDQQGEDITGKWVVDAVDVKMPGLNPKEKEALKQQFVQPFTNAVFDFKPDHHVTLSAHLRGMPKPDSWEYDAVKRLITIREQSKGAIMKIHVTEERGVTFFSLAETPAILKVHKKLD